MNDLEINDRTMVEVNKSTFQILKEYVSSITEHTDFHDAICITCESEDVKEWLKKARFQDDEKKPKTYWFNEKTAAVFITHKDKKYIAVKGVSDVTVDPQLLEFEEMNAAVFNLLISVKFTSPKIDSSQAVFLYDNILYKSDTNQNLRRVTMNELSPFVDEVRLYKINEQSFCINYSLERVFCYLMFLDIKEHEHITSFRNELFDTIINGNENIPFHQLSRSMKNIATPAHAFLDIYRCLERIFSAPTIKDLVHEFSELSKHSTFHIMEKIESVTGWRQNEEQGLNKLINLLDFGDLNTLFSLLTSTTFNKSDFSEANVLVSSLSKINDESTEEYITQQRMAKRSLANAITNKIYKSRNATVHYRPVFDKELITDNDFIILYKICLMLVTKIYGKIF